MILAKFISDEATGAVARYIDLSQILNEYKPSSSVKFDDMSGAEISELILFANFMRAGVQLCANLSGRRYRLLMLVLRLTQGVDTVFSAQGEGQSARMKAIMEMMSSKSLVSL